VLLDCVLSFLLLACAGEENGARQVRVVVLDATGRPSSGAVVRVLKPGPIAGSTWIEKVARTSAEGTTRFEDLSEDAATIEVVRGGPEPAGGGTVPPLHQKIPESGGTLEFQFRKGVGLRGVVVFEDGSPVQATVVRTIAESELENVGWNSGMTDPAGRFEIEVLEGVPHRITSIGVRDDVTFRGYVSGAVAGEAPVRVVLHPIRK
jgi:hypothetical protein